jgi:A/G-specific adenine glycosylase
MGGVSPRRLLRWFRAAARELPWRTEPRDPYLVLVSEFMLQQTQVERVVPRFAAFIAAFPNLAALAAAAEDEVLAVWSGLGYYRRARLLHRLAREVAADGGSLRRTAAELARLPGIGPYTAAAVASLAFGERVPVLDGNTMRVGARVLGLAADPRSSPGRRRLAAWIEGLMVGAGPPGAVNEALMELGATVCTPLAPGCPSCPLAAACVARAAGRPEAYPPPRRRRATVALRWVAACAVAPDGRWLLRRVDEGPILRGLWLPPLVELDAGRDPTTEARRVLPGVAAEIVMPAPAVRHSITHRRIEVLPLKFSVEAAAPPSDEWRWADPAAPGLPTSTLLAKLVTAFEALEGSP